MRLISSHALIRSNEYLPLKPIYELAYNEVALSGRKEVMSMKAIKAVKDLMSPSSAYSDNHIAV